MKKQIPKKLLNKKLKKRELAKKRKIIRKKIQQDDLLYEKTKKLAKKMGVKFIGNTRTIDFGANK